MAVLVTSEMATVLKELGYTLQDVVDIGNEVRPMPPEAITLLFPATPAAPDPGGFYGDTGYNLPDLPPTLTPAPAPAPVVGAAVVVTVAMLQRVLGSVAGRQAFNLLRTLTGGAGRVGGNIWTRIPSWLKSVLGVLGITEGAPFILEEILDSSNGVAPSNGVVPTGPAGPGGMVDPRSFSQVVGTWDANGVTFYRLLDGRIAVQNKHGRWKVWRPKRPIVIMPTGASNLRLLLKADKVLDRQAKALDSMLNRRTRRSTRANACSSCGLVRGHRAGCITINN